jgi:hypothetical protein
MNADFEEPLPEWMEELLKELGRSPVKNLPADFVSVTVMKIQKRAYRKSNRRFYFISVAIFILVTAFACFFLFGVGRQASSMLLKSLWTFKWVYLFLFAMMLCWQWVENKLSSSFSI